MSSTRAAKAFVTFAFFGCTAKVLSFESSRQPPILSGIGGASVVTVSTTTGAGGVDVVPATSSVGGGPAGSGDAGSGGVAGSGGSAGSGGNAGGGLPEGGPDDAALDVTDASVESGYVDAQTAFDVEAYDAPVEPADDDGPSD